MDKWYSVTLWKLIRFVLVWRVLNKVILRDVILILTEVQAHVLWSLPTMVWKWIKIFSCYNWTIIIINSSKLTVFRYKFYIRWPFPACLTSRVCVSRYSFPVCKCKKLVKWYIPFQFAFILRLLNTSVCCFPSMVVPLFILDARFWSLIICASKWLIMMVLTNIVKNI